MPPIEKGRIKIQPANDDNAYEVIFVKLDSKDSTYRTSSLYDDIKPTVNETRVIYTFTKGGYWQQEFGKGGTKMPSAFLESIESLSLVLERMC